MTYLAAEERILAVRATPGFNAATLATMLDVADRVDDYAENLGLLLMAVGVTTILARTRQPWQRAADVLLVVAIVAVVVTSCARSQLNDIALVVTGAIAVPLWTLRLSYTPLRATIRSASPLPSARGEACRDRPQ